MFFTKQRKRLEDTQSRCCQGKENLKRIEELTQHINSFPDIVKNSSKDFVELLMIRGTGMGWNLMNEKDTSVDKWFSSKGSIFPKHEHNAKEWIIVYEGELRLYIHDEVKILKRGDSYFTLPGTPHMAEFMEDTWYITITIPKAEGFPR